MPETVVLIPIPVEISPSGERVKVQVPEDGNPLNATLPVRTRQVGWVIVPITGAEGIELTVSVKVAEAAAQGDPKGLLVITVIITFLPISPLFGV